MWCRWKRVFVADTRWVRAKKRTCFGACQPGPKITATASFTTCGHWCQIETEMRIETKNCKRPLSASSRWMGRTHFEREFFFAREANFDSTTIECWECLRLRAANPWQWSNANLCKRLFIYREKEGGVNDLRKFRVDKISTKKSLSLQFDSAGGGQREFHWVLFSWTQRAVFNISRNTI